VLAAARAQPDRLVVGVDASAAAMAVASGRAAANPGRGGLANALFVVAAAEALPPELDGVADLVAVWFPWGSLLRGLLGVDPAMLTGLTQVMRPGACLSMLVSATVRDRGAGVAPIQEEILHALTERYGRYGLDLIEVRPATPADVAAHSTWGKRLGSSGRRPAWLLRPSLDQRDRRRDHADALFDAGGRTGAGADGNLRGRSWVVMELPMELDLGALRLRALTTRDAALLVEATRAGCGRPDRGRPGGVAGRARPSAVPVSRAISRRGAGGPAVRVGAPSMRLCEPGTAGHGPDD
jgi:16S rRNA (adenine(1408)-N(1))-methyltransferase